jgi:alpha-L-fucosidase
MTRRNKTMRKLILINYNLHKFNRLIIIALVVSFAMSGIQSHAQVKPNLQEDAAAAQNERQRQRAPETQGEQENGMAEAVAAAVKQLPPLPAGPYKPTWESVKENYRYPEWFSNGKFGIYMHWGLYSVPARQSEWYFRHMYGNPGVRDWHIQHFGPLNVFGYKDFIPMFRAEKYDPAQWAAMFKDAGARYVALTAEHHDGFSLWDSRINKRNAVNMGPLRDLVGDLAKAVRAQGLIFGVTNHSMENFTFLQPENFPQNPEETTDLYDPEWADFYHVADRNVEARTVFYRDWVLKNMELIDKYQPSMLWYDNGVNTRTLDPLKLYVAAYYYNRAKEWGRQVTLSTKGQAYLAGSILDHERQGRAEQEIYPDPWQVDESVHSRWGYLTETNYLNVYAVVWRIVENTSKNGNLLLNFSPMPDGTFNQVQIDLLKGIGVWMRQNGEGIYDSRPWIKYGEGLSCKREQRPNQAPYGQTDFRFTRKGNVLYVFMMAWPENGSAAIRSLATGGKGFSGKISRITILGNDKNLDFSQDAEGLHVTLPPQRPGEHVWTLKIEGLKLEDWQPATR